MAKTNGKQKGKRGERELVPMFSEWWGVPDSWARTPDSGAFATRRKQKGHEEDKFQADIFGPPEATLSVEAKYREVLDFDGLLYGTALAAFGEWWAQAAGQAGQGKVPLLVFRKNRRPWWAAMRRTDYARYVAMALLESDATHAYIMAGTDRLVLLSLATFLTAAQPSNFGKADAIPTPSSALALNPEDT